MEPIESIEYKGFTIEIHQDEDPESPREWDNFGTMVCFHSRYDLGDKHEYSIDIAGFVEFKKFFQEHKKTVIALPLYLYDHSGLRMKVGSFAGLLPQGHAEFDTMMVGYIYVEKSKVKNELGKWDKKTRERATKILMGEVQIYDDYLAGNVFGFMVKDENGEDVKDKNGETLDSCWGFYGMDDIINEAKTAIDIIC